MASSSTPSSRQYIMEYEEDSEDEYHTRYDVQFTDSEEDDDIEAFRTRLNTVVTVEALPQKTADPSPSPSADFSSLTASLSETFAHLFMGSENVPKVSQPEELAQSLKVSETSADHVKIEESPPQAVSIPVSILSPKKPRIWLSKLQARKTVKWKDLEESQQTEETSTETDPKLSLNAGSDQGSSLDGEGEKRSLSTNAAAHKEERNLSTNRLSDEEIDDVIQKAQNEQSARIHVAEKAKVNTVLDPILCFRRKKLSQRMLEEEARHNWSRSSSDDDSSDYRHDYEPRLQPPYSVDRGVLHIPYPPNTEEVYVDGIREGRDEDVFSATALRDMYEARGASGVLHDSRNGRAGRNSSLPRRNTAPTNTDHYAEIVWKSLDNSKQVSRRRRGRTKRRRKRRNIWV